MRPINWVRRNLGPQIARPVAIVAIACAGLAAAVGIAMVASSLGSQPIGISEEPLDAGSRLAAPMPAEPRPGARPENGVAPSAPARTQTTGGRDGDRVAGDDSDREDRDRKDEDQDDRHSGRDEGHSEDDRGSSDDSGSDD